MIDSKFKILEMFKEGKLEKEETLELLAAIDEAAEIASREDEGQNQEQAKELVRKSPGRAESFDDLDKIFNVTTQEQLKVKLSSGGFVKVAGIGEPYVVIKDGCDDGNEEDSALYLKESASAFLVQSREEIDLDIKVPQKFNIDLQASGGDIEVENVEGTLDIKTSGGDIACKRIGGKADINTAGGDIRLEDSEFSGLVKTSGGDIGLSHIIGDVIVRTAGGDITAERITYLSDPMEKRDLAITTSGGDIDIKGAPTGVNANTSGGDITIHEADKWINAKTSGGDIQIWQVCGSVHAVTNGGDVTVGMTDRSEEIPRDITVKTAGGDVELQLPEGFPMDLDITIRWSGSDLDEYQIKSDFGIEIDHSCRGNISGRPWGMVLHGWGTVNGGGNKVTVEVNEGDVTIKMV